MLPEQTRKKVAIHGKQYSLLDEIDASELPECFGGARTAPNCVPRAEKVPRPELGNRLREAATATPPPAPIS